MGFPGAFPYAQYSGWVFHKLTVETRGWNRTGLSMISVFSLFLFRIFQNLFSNRNRFSSKSVRTEFEICDFCFKKFVKVWFWVSKKNEVDPKFDIEPWQVKIYMGVEIS